MLRPAPGWWRGKRWRSQLDGIGACVRQQLTIGRDVLVAAGAVCVADSVESAVTVMGVPARRAAKDLGINDEL